MSHTGTDFADDDEDPEDRAVAKEYEERALNGRFAQAAREGNYRKLIVAVSEGADVRRFRTLRKQTALMLVSGSNTSGTLGAITFLVDAKAGLEAKDDTGWTPLLHACRNNHREAANRLLELKASVKARAMDDKTAMMLATMEEGGRHLVEDLARNNADVNKRDERGWPVLFYACEGKSQGLVKWLLEHEAEARGKARDGTTALMVAADRGHQKVGVMLLEGKCNVNAISDSGATALTLSLRARRPEYANWLLDVGADTTSDSEAVKEALLLAENGGFHVMRSRMGQKKKKGFEFED